MAIRYWLISGWLVAQTLGATDNHQEALRLASEGVALSQGKDYARAVKSYRRALELDQTLPNIHLNLGLAYFKEGHFTEALTELKQQPSSKQVVTLEGMSYFGLGKYKIAAEALEPLAKAEPDNQELSYLLAKCYLWSAQYNAAMTMFRQLLERDPNSAPAHMLLAEALDADDREQEATEEFKAALAAAPQQPDAHFGLGYLYWKQKAYVEAEHEFRKELSNNPRHAPSLAYLGNIALRQQRGDALEVLKTAESYDPTLHSVHQDLGIYYQDHSRLDLALREYQAAVKTAPNNYDSHYRLARIYQLLHRPEDARREFAIVEKLHRQKQEEPLMEVSGPH